MQLSFSNMDSALGSATRTVCLALGLAGYSHNTAAWDGSSKREEAPVISKISVVPRDVFDGALQSWPYRTANRLHIETKERVIRRELLFDVGEHLSPEVEEALAQTERNLRALVFVRDAKVEKIPMEDGSVHIMVVTNDSWSTQPQIGIAKTGDRLTWVVGLAEQNVLGLGKQFKIARESGLDREENQFSYTDPRVLGSRVRASTFYSDRSDGERSFLSVGRPFFSLRTKWGFATSIDSFDQLDPIYSEGELIDSLRHIRRSGEFQVSRAVWFGPGSAVRLHGGYRFLEDEGDFERRRFGILRFGVSSVQHRFIKRTHINRFEAAEDFNLGNEGSFFVGLSTDALGGEGRSLFILASERRGFSLGPETFAIASVGYSSRRRRSQNENAILRSRFELVHKFSEKQVLLAKAEWIHGTRLDPGVQVRLGAERGLRGYPVRQFNGDRSVLFGLEQRWFVADDVAELVSFGIAGFFETGVVWPETEPVRLGDLRSDIGVALLIGRTRWSGQAPGVRFDFAYALDPIDNVGRWQFSAGSSVRF